MHSKFDIVLDKVDDICEKFELGGLHQHPTYKQFKRLFAELKAAAPAEDVRAVVEPVGNEQAVYLILFDDYDVRPEILIGESAARQRYAQLSNSWNAHLFVKLESNSRDDAHAKSNYRHPQRPFVLPEERTRRTSDICDEAYDNGWNACLDAVEELNK